MFKHVLAAVAAAALIAAPVAPAFAQAKTEKAEKNTAKKLTPQQQKMKDCGPKWAAHKKEKNVKGRAEHRKFLSTCLKS